jgi:hypothetical protein
MLKADQNVLLVGSPLTDSAALESAWSEYRRQVGEAGKITFEQGDRIAQSESVDS